MAKFNGAVAGLTPTSATANWVLEEIAANVLYVQEHSGGGEATATTAMRTRIARDSAIGTGARTAGLVQQLDRTVAATQIGFFSTTYASTQPTIAVGALFQWSWNCYGGGWRWLADRGEEYIMVGAISMECRADTASQGVSSYNVVWTEL